MPTSPNEINLYAGAGSQWSTVFTLKNDDGSIMDIANKTFAFVVRRAYGTSAPKLVYVAADANEQGSLTVDVAAGTVQILLTPAATERCETGSWPFALWMNPGEPDATALVAGNFVSDLIAAP